MKRRNRLNHPSSENKSLDDQALNYLEKNGSASVPALSNALKMTNPSLVMRRLRTWFGA